MLTGLKRRLTMAVDDEMENIFKKNLNEAAEGKMTR